MRVTRRDSIRSVPGNSPHLLAPRIVDLTLGGTVLPFLKETLTARHILCHPECIDRCQSGDM
jgi:hypothetical protein